MSETRPRFTPVPDAPHADAVAARVGTNLLMVGLHALSQRALKGISDAFTLILVGLTCGLAFHVLDNPTQLQIVTVFGFAVFCLLIDMMRRRTK